MVVVVFGPFLIELALNIFLESASGKSITEEGSTSFGDVSCNFAYDLLV